MMEDSVTLQKLLPWAFFFVSITLFALLSLLAYKERLKASIAVLAGAVLAACFVYVDHVSKIGASLTQVTIKLREASDGLLGLRKLALLTGKTLIQVDSRVGAIGGDTATNRDQLKADVVSTLTFIGIDQNSINEVKNLDREAVNIGVSKCYTLSRSILHIGSKPDTRMDDGSANGKLSKGIRNVSRLLDKFAAHDSFTDRALAGFSYYFNTGEHKDVEFWRDRDRWPVNPVQPGADKSSSCRY
jgi:hypothetical protein